MKALWGLMARSRGIQFLQMKARGSVLPQTQPFQNSDQVGGCPSPMTARMGDSLNTSLILRERFTSFNVEDATALPKGREFRWTFFR
jgi:hypothetical protein